MSLLDDVKDALDAQQYFSHCSAKSYLRVLDTPNIWGLPFSDAIMPRALERQAEFERSIVEIVQRTRYRCDVASLNSPDLDWSKVILGAIDTALTTVMDRDRPTQFRFLFGQTPMYPVSDPPNYAELKCSLVRLVRNRCASWEVLPDIWIGRFYRLEKGIRSSVHTKMGRLFFENDGSKMTWNHAKIVAMDGAEALAGGHNLNMDLFRSYPPVHDVSVVVHGEAAYGSQAFLDEMWGCGTDLLTKEYLDVTNLNALSWKNADGKAGPTDPLQDADAREYMAGLQGALVDAHDKGEESGDEQAQEHAPEAGDPPVGIREQDLRTLEDLELELFPERVLYPKHDKFAEFKASPRVLSVGKYWTGPKVDTDYKKGSELMKETLIMGARGSIRMSQMDLVSAWKKNWSDHVVCHWIMEALLANPDLTVQVVVSPLDAGAGAEGDQYSFGSGAIRTFELMEYYMTHDAETDAPVPDPGRAHADALRRLHIAPLYYTAVDDALTIEGETYKWPGLSPEGYTATLKQPLLRDKPPKQGIIGSAVSSVVKAGGLKGTVKSAPGNHSKITIIDDSLYVVGSDNLYPGFLSEFNYLVEGPAVSELLKSYWDPLWRFSSPHCVNPACVQGCHSKPRTEKRASRGLPNTVRDH